MTNELTKEERRDLVELGARPVEAKRALALIDSLTDQCQRDYQLATAWQARHEALRVESTVERERLTARLAELEHANAEAASCIRGLSDERDAALSRAEAAELENAALDAAHRRMLNERNEWQDTAAAYLDEGRARWERAESECAALRDSVRQASQENDALRAELERADTVGTDLRLEVADLRAEVERWRKHFDETALPHARLAAANALLERVRKNHTGTKVWEDIDAHLAACSGQAKAPPTIDARAAAEQRVLDACAALTIDPDGEGSPQGELWAIAEAELARREGTETPVDSQRSLEDLLKANAKLREDLSK
jgi:hypothetical protein